MTEIEKETGMTDAECEYWDDYFTKNPPKVDPSKNGGFAQKNHYQSQPITPPQSV